MMNHTKQNTAYGNKLIAILVIILLVVIFLSIKHLIGPKHTEIVSGKIDVTQDPEQIAYPEAEAIEIEVDDITYIISPHAKYKISARLISKKRYRTDITSPISPFDLALGWGKLGDTQYDEYLSFRQFQRRCRMFVSSDTPLDDEYIDNHFSNNHIIPANNNIKKAINKIRKNQLITLEGYLVIVNSETVIWDNRSLPHGAKTCRIIYVKKVRIGNKIYE